jgi:hypothetical protein
MHTCEGMDLKNAYVCTLGLGPVRRSSYHMRHGQHPTETPYHIRPNLILYAVGLGAAKYWRRFGIKAFREAHSHCHIDRSGQRNGSIKT